MNRFKQWPRAWSPNASASSCTYLETDDFAAAQARMAETDVNARWQTGMAQYFVGSRPDEATGGCGVEVGGRGTLQPHSDRVTVGGEQVGLHDQFGSGIERSDRRARRYSGDC